MLTGKRIRTIEKHISHIPDGSEIYIGVTITNDLKEKIKELGFEHLNSGETLLPSPNIGSVNKFNSQGRLKINRNLPKIDMCRDQYYEIKDWHGNYHSGTRIVCRKVFQKELIPPPEVNLTIVGNDEAKFLVAEKILKKEKDYSEEKMVHIVNVFLEIFGVVDFLDSKLSKHKKLDIKRINWEILRDGDYSNKEFNIDSLLSNRKKSDRVVIKNRLELINEYNPNLIVTGINGYRGYIVFGFPKSNTFIFESLEYGNATYVFKGDWKSLSKMSKREIIDGNYYSERIIHLSDWSEKVKAILNELE